MLTKIWNFIKGKLFIAAVIIALLIFSAIQCSRIRELKRQSDIHDQNLIALNDSLKYEKTKNGETLVTIAGYIASEKELKKINKSLWDEVNAQKGKVITLSNVVIRLKQDSAALAKNVDHLNTVIGKLIKIDSTHVVAPWKLGEKYDANNFFNISGKTIVEILSKNPLTLSHDTTYMTGFLNQIDLTWGQKIEKGKLRVFVTSAWPGFTVASMSGVLIDPNTNPYFKDLMKKRHFFSGFSIGIGITPGIDILNQKFGITAGPTFTYSIYTW